MTREEAINELNKSKIQETEKVLVSVFNNLESTGGVCINPNE